MRETWVRSLGWEDPLEKKMATHSSILAWRIPWTEEPGLQSPVDQEAAVYGVAKSQTRLSDFQKEKKVRLSAKELMPSNCGAGGDS